MENTQPTTGKFAIRFGLILGGIGIIFSLMLYFMDMQYDQGMGKQIVSTVFLVAIIALAIFQFKKANGGYLTLGEALKTGIGTALIGAVITVIYLLLYVNVIDPDFSTKIADIARAGMIENNPELTQEQIDTAVEMQQKFFWVTYPIIFIFNIFIGFIVSLITGLILKKSENEM
ncbi:hypothetical protein JoomaDRAFT_0161 [Galbibacter orientalis DSM 19592]|mgnify:CR=1 FL=1|uniref:DUF4199 domain-containing protein n=1 Tax=Galbibacter orientalis DSM 19592 TaxID=926559 RepID=I3C0S8_9FLAO|nr:DUF4199 domain-containing protein [Galbibacter orientalis]EIJ37221.1 hypothetical protein JoomaDRAFT_0161 [Galbibacter orientalis DSM 19592]